MTQYNPDRWVVLKMIHNGTTLHKVLGHWHGGYLNGDSWRLNSGITHVESVPGFYRFHGSSGSIYNCHREAYGLTMMTSEIVGRMQERFPNQIEVLDDCDWDSFDFGDTNADGENTPNRSRLMIGFVYVWENRVNGKRYVGLHVGSEDDGYVGSGVAFKRAIEKYGIENFSRTIVYREEQSVRRLYEAEYSIINALNAVKDPTFYNLTNTDPKNVVGPGQRLITDQHRKNISNAKKGKPLSEANRLALKKPKSRVPPFSEERRRAMSKARKGKPGKIPSLETREKMRLSQLGKPGTITGKKWANDGTKNMLCFEHEKPENWSWGQLRDRKK